MPSLAEMRFQAWQIVKGFSFHLKFDFNIAGKPFVENCDFSFTQLLSQESLYEFTSVS